MTMGRKALIRSKEYLVERGLYDVMINTKTQIPLIYQYSQTPATVDSMRADKVNKNIIGYVDDIREEDGMVVCSVHLDIMKSLSDNFMGLIDNYTVKTRKTSPSNPEVTYELVRFVVYNKEFKRKVDEKIDEQRKSATNNTKPIRTDASGIRMYGNRGGRKYAGIERSATKS